MGRTIEERLDNGERLLWERQPGSERLVSGLRTIRIAGHILLTVISIMFAFLLIVAGSLRVSYGILLGILLIAATNAPLLVWAYYRLPALCGSGDAVFFLTDRRVGLLRPDGEIRQAPICPGLSVDVKLDASLVEFSLGERTPVSFGGLRREEIFLVSSVAEGLIKKCT